MRYYDIIITQTSGEQFARYTSFPNGKTDLGALQVEFDIPVSTLANPVGAASIKVWGVSLQTIGQASDFNGMSIQVFGGMKPGLPLATQQANNAGLLLQGTIQQAFGNWINTAQWVEFIVVQLNQTTAESPLNIVMDWKKGTTLASAITQTLSIAAPSYKATINISSNLVLPADEPSFHGNLIQFAQYVRDVSASINKTTPVDILITETEFVVSDGTSPTAPKTLLFNDLIGQPTWIDPGTIQVTVVMRADIDIFDTIKLPQTQVTFAPSDVLQPASKSVFQGNFVLKDIRHVGNFRQPDAQAWVTTMNCAPLAVAAT